MFFPSFFFVFVWLVWATSVHRRERRAERLRRTYDALGREQNGIFESLAEYTHEVQAEVRALQIARDRLSAKRVSSAGPGYNMHDDFVVLDEQNIGYLVLCSI